MQDICIRQVAHDFKKATLNSISTAYHSRVVELLPLDLPIELAGETIQDEAYWKRRSQARWTNCDPAKHASSYKQLYFERMLQDTIEEYAYSSKCVQQLSEPLCDVCIAH
jgi:hypothetical protein